MTPTAKRLVLSLALAATLALMGCGSPQEVVHRSGTMTDMSTGASKSFDYTETRETKRVGGWF